MEYKDEDGNVMEIAYSVQLQKQDLKLKKIIIGIMLVGLVVLVTILVILALLQFRGNHLGYILQNLICKQYTGG